MYFINVINPVTETQSANSPCPYKGYVSGDVFPIIQQMDRLTKNAVIHELATKP